MLPSYRGRRALFSVTVTAALLCAPTPSDAGDNPREVRVGADQGSMVRLVSGGRGGLGTAPHGLTVGAPAQVFHIPWQEFGWIPWKGFKLWLVNDHGVPVVRPTGGKCIAVMDHTLLVQFEQDGETWSKVAEMLPEGEDNWNEYPRDHEKFKFYEEQYKAGNLVAGKRGRIRPGEVGRVYGLGDHCCTNEANGRIGRGSGPGPSARGLNRIGFELWRWGITDYVRDVWSDFGEVLKARGFWGSGAPSSEGAGSSGAAAPAAPEGMNLTGLRAIGNARIPYTPSIGGILMGVSFYLHARKAGVVPAAVSAGVGVGLWHVGTRAIVSSVGWATTRAVYFGFGARAGIKAGRLATGLTSKAIPIIGEVLLASDIIFFLANQYYETDAGWGDVWAYWTGKLDKPTRSAGLPPPADQGAYYD